MRGAPQEDERTVSEGPKTIQVKNTPHMKMRRKYMERLKEISRKPPNKI